MESQKYVIRELFLIEFVKQISIHAGKLMPIPIEEPKIEISRKQELKKIITVPLGKQLPRRPLQRPVQRLMPMQQMQKSTPTQQRMQRSRQITTPTKNISQMPSTLSRKPLMVKGMAPKQTSLTPSFVGLGLGKLSMFLSDPAIIALECQGPGIPITANRAGIIQKTNILLNETEIKDIVTQISEKTRIPILSGVFKAALENYIFTAVISDYVGTRFLIQKKKMPSVPQAFRY